MDRVFVYTKSTRHAASLEIVKEADKDRARRYGKYEFTASKPGETCTYYLVSLKDYRKFEVA